MYLKILNVDENLHLKSKWNCKNFIKFQAEENTNENFLAAEDKIKLSTRHDGHTSL